VNYQFDQLGRKKNIRKTKNITTRLKYG
jgi:hypothetical protein